LLDHNESRKSRINTKALGWVSIEAFIRILAWSRLYLTSFSRSFFGYDIESIRKTSKIYEIAAVMDLTIDDRRYQPHHVHRESEEKKI
jgi:hypothetical protein